MAEQITDEPKRRGSTVADRDGHIWKRGNTLWVDTTKGDEWRGRYPFYWVVSKFGPLTDGERYLQHRRDELVAYFAGWSAEALDRAKVGYTVEQIADAVQREKEWNA